MKDKFFIDGKLYYFLVMEVDYLDVLVLVQGVEGYSFLGGCWERRDMRGGGRGCRIC